MGKACEHGSDHEKVSERKISNEKLKEKDIGFDLIFFKNCLRIELSRRIV